VITNYSWNFGDGTTGSGATVMHSYSNVSSYNVTLTVTNDRGLTASTTQPVSVGATQPPSAVFTASTLSPTQSPVDPVNFNAGASTAAPGRTITSYSWNFGDGATGNGINVIHTFLFRGAFTVTLTVTDDLGQKGTFSLTLIVQ
jgi:PKD repeat protein